MKYPQVIVRELPRGNGPRKVGFLIEGDAEGILAEALAEAFQEVLGSIHPKSEFVSIEHLREMAQEAVTTWWNEQDESTRGEIAALLDVAKKD